MTLAPLPLIPEFYSRDDLDNLFDDLGLAFERQHITTWMSRKNVQAGQAVELAMELPNDCWIAGGFMKSLILGQPPKDYDIYFKGQTAFYNLVRRIHNAPAGTFLHGYEADMSVREFADSQDAMYINFTHPSKPTLQLIRIRWFETPRECLDKFDFRMCQFALGNDLDLHFEPNALDDVRMRRLSVVSAVFELSTSLRIKRYIDAGWSWHNNRYDSYNRDNFLRTAQQHMTRMQRRARDAGTPPPENIGDYGEFATYD